MQKKRYKNDGKAYKQMGKHLVIPELEGLLLQKAQVTAVEPFGGGWYAGTAELEGQKFPCWSVGKGLLPVAAYGRRTDGTTVLACGNGRLIKPEITAAAGLREAGTEWACQYEHSCGALLFTKAGTDIHYLIIEGTSGHIGYPKGHMEEGESILDAVARELREEVNVTKFSYMTGFRVDADVITRLNRKKTVTYFLAAFDPAENELRRQEEEVANLWLLPYAEAHARVNTALDRELLEKAQAHLLKEYPY